VVSVAEPALDEGGLVRVRLDLGYDGTGFHGWARQPGVRTVQEVVEAALSLVLRLRPAPGTVVAGRTDAGVHARGQVCHVDLPRGALTVAARVAQRLNAVLPADVRVRRAEAAPPGFDARFAALGRRYSYRVDDRPGGPDPLCRHVVAGHRRPLDADVMGRAARPLLGEHDFLPFARPRPGATTVRTLTRLDVSREPGGVVRLDAEADAFCHHQVRFLAGALLAVGDGRRAVDWPSQVLAAGVRDPRVELAPAHGLVLEDVRYPPDGELAARVAAARQVREVRR
jgi:tRNA pseudouridine38-40 synthase